jgi:lauroyl/myristoyl acyltransferase
MRGTTNRKGAPSARTRAKKRLLRLATRLFANASPALGRRLRPLLSELVRRSGFGSRMDVEGLRANLRRYFPGRDAAWIDATARAIGRNAVQAKFFDKHLLPQTPSDRLERMCVWVDAEAFTRARAEGRGAIVVSLHYGRYWAAPVWLSRFGGRVMAFQKTEGKLPAAALTLSGGTLSASDMSSTLRAARALKDGAIVCLQLDAGRVQNPVVVDFLGLPTRVTPSPIHIAKLSGAIVVPILAVMDERDPERIRLTSYEVVDPRLLPADEPAEVTMRRIFASFEPQVRADPTQWYSVSSAHKRIVDS